MRDEEKRTYQSDVQALPSLKMVLVHTDKESRQRALDQQDHKGVNEEIVLKLIERLSRKE